ncbi:MAG: glycogen synthase GlgA [Tissierellia bacterium]|jgi:starch synthase|nr:glycogen synthase GlgA [Tissierellia bacterium]
MKIFYIAAEASPFVKTGGLADVAGSLPKAFKEKGEDISVVMPLYGQIPFEYKEQMEYIGSYFVDIDWRRQHVGVFKIVKDGVDFYFIDNEYYFNRNTIYGQGDDGERFVYFSKACVQLLRFLDIKPDIVHANDWHSGLIPLYIKDFARGDGFYQGIKTAYTIHNIKYQGVFPANGMIPLMGLSTEYFHEDGIKFYDAINMMKAGIVYCDLLTTVSETYAHEITYPYFGEGLDGIIRKHERKLVGIVNGIDYDKYNPKTDKWIDYNYDLDTIEEKVKNKLELQKLFDLPVREDVPLIAMVTRLVDLKGVDLLDYILGEMLQLDIQFVVLGTGERKYEEMLEFYDRIFRDKMSARIYFNEVHSHKIYSAADLYLMPSIAEPCGISQLISMRYGTIPIVRETGGLKDTVEAYNKYTGEGTGFSFSNINAHEMLDTVKIATEIYGDKKAFQGIIKSAMKKDFSWDMSCDLYLKYYDRIIKL